MGIILKKLQKRKILVSFLKKAFPSSEQKLVLVKQFWDKGTIILPSHTRMKEFLQHELFLFSTCFPNEKNIAMRKSIDFISTFQWSHQCSIKKNDHTNVDLIFILTVLNLQKLPMLMSDLIKINIKLVFWSEQSSTISHQGTNLMQFLF